MKEPSASTSSTMRTEKEKAGSHITPQWAKMNPFEAAARINELERENAALRTVLKRWLKVADDCHLEQQEVGYSEYNITAGLMVDTRALLDARRKEAQP